MKKRTDLESQQNQNIKSFNSKLWIRIISVVLSVLMLLSLVSLAACGGKSGASSSEALKFGMGIYTAVSKATNADGDTNGESEAAHTVAAVLLDKDGKPMVTTIED